MINQRNSVFNGWQLIVQQDHYQQLNQTIEGNIVEWKHETNYAIVQPNGKVLGLLVPNGKLSWRAQKNSLWGLAFSQYNFNSNLDPNLLFAGQWLDEESGLAYNRFRYYDPESGNYISSDPIGLNGGEKPFGYVGNPLDWVDLFGLAKCPSIMRRKNGEMISAKVRVDPSDIKTGTTVSNAARKGIKRLKGDDIGHLLAKVLGGSGKDLDNLFGQLRKVNRGDYRKFEKAIRERIETTGKSVNLEWKFQTFSGSGKRPDRILFKVIQDNKLVDQQWFNNF